MIRFLTLSVLALFLATIAGCETQYRDILTLPGQGATQGTQGLAVPEKGTYYLFSSKDPKKALFQKDLAKGDEISFTVHGDNAKAVAKGTIIQLDDYSEGATYTWKIEEKKKE